MPGWRHKRVEEEIAKADANYELRAEAGKRGGIAKANAKHKGSIATVLPEQSDGEAVAKSYQPQPQEDVRDGTAPDPRSRNRLRSKGSSAKNPSPSQLRF